MKHLLLLAGLAVVVLVIQVNSSVRGGKKVDTRVFEMRTYYAHPGKMAALHARFRDHTMKLFVKHGMTNIGYWMPDKDQKGAGSALIYILAHKSKEAAAASFDAFRKDPDWIAARKASEQKAGGSLTEKDGVRSVFLRATAYSALK